MTLFDPAKAQELYSTLGLGISFVDAIESCQHSDGIPGLDAFEAIAKDPNGLEEVARLIIARQFVEHRTFGPILDNGKELVLLRGIKARRVTQVVAWLHSHGYTDGNLKEAAMAKSKWPIVALGEKNSLGQYAILRHDQEVSWIDRGSEIDVRHLIVAYRATNPS